MALYTILNFRDAFLNMLLQGFGRIVGVAVNTGVVDVAFGMTRFTSNLAFAPMVQWEGVLGQLGRQPDCRRVAASAIGAKYSGMYKGFQVAANTFIGSAICNRKNMTGITFHLCMGAVERKYLTMIEVNAGIQAVMACQTVMAE
jgi:hypothetical protein